MVNPLSLFRFVGEYKIQSENLEKFYNIYHYKFRPLEDVAVYELKVINELKIKVLESVNHFYLITAHLNIPDNYNFTNHDQTKDPPADFYHGHVAGNGLLDEFEYLQLRICPNIHNYTEPL